MCNVRTNVGQLAWTMHKEMDRGRVHEGRKGKEMNVWSGKVRERRDESTCEKERERGRLCTFSYRIKYKIRSEWPSG